MSLSVQKHQTGWRDYEKQKRKQIGKHDHALR